MANKHVINPAVALFLFLLATLAQIVSTVICRYYGIADPVPDSSIGLALTTVFYAYMCGYLQANVMIYISNTGDLPKPEVATKQPESPASSTNTETGKENQS